MFFDNVLQRGEAVAEKKDRSAKAERHLREEMDELSSLRVFLADPVSKRAFARLKKKERKLVGLLESIETNVQNGPFPCGAPSNADEALLERVFGKPTEEEQREREGRRRSSATSGGTVQLSDSNV